MKLFNFAPLLALLTVVPIPVLGCPIDTFKELTDPKRIIRKLGYDPEISYISQNSDRFTNSVTLYLHGFQSNKRFCLRSNLFQTPAVVFNFLDARHKGKTPLARSSFGQRADMAPALFILNAIVESNLATRINLVGFSRGAATVVNLIAVLNNPDHYKPLLKFVGIDTPKAQTILALIERGIIVLDCPLKDVRWGIMQHVRNYRSTTIWPDNNDNLSIAPWYSRIWSSIKNSLINCFDYCCYIVFSYLILPWCTFYAPWREHALYMLDYWQGLKLTTIIRYDNNDSFVSNYADQLFYQKIHNYNPFSTCLITTNGTGHCSQSSDLSDLFFTLTRQQPPVPWPLRINNKRY